MPDSRGKWGDVAWMLAVSAQGGLMVAMPVVIGLGVGYALDSHFGTLPWITLSLTLIGAITGPVLLYRWATALVKERLAKKQDEENS